MSELSLIRKFRKHAPSHPWLLVGPGQDCAALKWNGTREVVYKIDQVQEGTHFVLKGPEAATPREVGWKALAKTCSDLAAAGAWPVAAMVAVNLRKGTDPSVAMELYRGITACCRKYGCALAGGDLATSRNGLSIVVSMLGECPRGKMWTRSGARPGDWLFVTGPLGASRESRRHLTFQPRLNEARALRKLLGGSLHACIDVTDGLSRDLRHLCNESRVGAVLAEEFLRYTPAAVRVEKKTGRTALVQALGDGEDFELLFAVAPGAVERLLPRRGAAGLAWPVGFVVKREQGVYLARAGDKRLTPLPDTGYEHRT